METYGRCEVLPQARIRIRLLAALSFAVATAACAQIWIPLRPVPVTLQVLGVILSGLILGSRWGAISQLQYLAIGAIGLPVFAGWKAGPAAFAGPSGGYLFGFVLGAFAAGWIFERLEGRTRLAPWAAGIAGIAGVYALGAPWLSIWLRCFDGQPWNACIPGAWRLGILPFIVIDLLKAAVASGLALGGRWGCGLLQTFRNLE